jgi:hypothetical protein
MDPIRLLTILLLVGLVVVLTVWYRGRSRRAPDPETLPRLPEQLRGEADRTWVVFTTPFCAACGPVETSLRSSEPASRVVRVDATVDTDLARRFGVRRAPTVLLAGPDGHVERTFAQAEDVRSYLVGASVGR